MKSKLTSKNLDLIIIGVKDTTVQYKSRLKGIELSAELGTKLDFHLTSKNLGLIVHLNAL